MNRLVLVPTAALAAGLTAGLVLGTAPAQASGSDGRVQRTGSCSGSTDWKIKAKPDDGRVEVEAEIDSNRTGQRWTWTLRHDGGASANGTSVTRGPSGSFSVERRLVDGPGSDSFVFRAVNPRSGEVCVASVTL
ncbi:hypothetical protein [Nocardioides sp.]|uniref:hypothetical protein n=1 Tax=Nocardioides sp. TaxID=35761 RepID=UPI00351735B6